MKTLTEPQTNTGLDATAAEQIVSLLRRTLGNNYVLAVKTQNFHWNVTGMFWHPLHLLFGEQYDILAENNDAIAERIRKVGGVALGSMAELVANSDLTEVVGALIPAESMVQQLLDDHETVCRELRTGIDTTASLGDAATSDFLTGLLETHEELAWKLRAHLA